MGFEENHFHGTCRKPRQKCPPYPPKAARNPHVLHPTLDLSLHPHRRPKNSLLARQQALPGAPLPGDSIMGNLRWHWRLAKRVHSELVVPSELLKWTWGWNWGRAGGTLMRREEGEVIRGETAAPARNCPAEGGMLASCHRRQSKRPREGTVAGGRFLSDGPFNSQTAFSSLARGRLPPPLLLKLSP